MSLFRYTKHEIAPTLTAVIRAAPTYETGVYFNAQRAKAAEEIGADGVASRVIPRAANVGLVAIALCVERWEGEDAAHMPWPDLDTPDALETRLRAVAALPAPVVPPLVGLCVRRLVLGETAAGN